MPNIGPFELLVILFIALLLLGPSRLPDLANALGKSIREFRKAANEVEDVVRAEPAARTLTAAGSTPATPLPPNTPPQPKAPGGAESQDPEYGEYLRWRAERDKQAAIPAAESAGRVPAPAEELTVAGGDPGPNAGEDQTGAGA